MAGDRIVYVDDSLVAGIKIKNEGVMRLLKGPKGSKVKVKNYRRGVSDLLEFTITRDVIPTYSVDVAYMLDKETGLYFRDGKYIYPKHKTAKGKKDFWARGDGWVLAGLAKVLQDMPETYVRQPFFVEKYVNLARGVKKLQQPQGHWTRSMMDPEQAPGYETSGTAFFCYGLLWGVNHGYLSKKEFAPTIDKAWNYLTTIALQKDGKVGYVQPIGERAIPGQTVDANSQANFGVGAFLLAACEYVKYIGR